MPSRSMREISELFRSLRLNCKVKFFWWLPLFKNSKYIEITSFTEHEKFVHLRNRILLFFSSDLIIKFFRKETNESNCHENELFMVQNKFGSS